METLYFHKTDILQEEKDKELIVCLSRYTLGLDITGSTMQITNDLTNSKSLFEFM